MSNLSVILPFNAPADERAAMYKRKQPEVLWMPVILYHLPNASASDLETAAVRLKDHFEKKSELTQMGGHVIAPTVRMIEMPAFLIALLHQRQLDWMHNGVYLQAGYYGEPGVAGIARSVACAMTLSDLCICAQGVANPSAQVAIPASAEDANDFEQEVRNHFRSGVGVWPRVLVAHRSRVLVTAHAIMLGRDPVTEYDRFKAAGGVHHLDYVHLCP